jgi:16S rRNA processing protein RimM
VRIHGGEEPEDELKSLTGFELTDTTSGLTGTISEVVQHPGQLMAVAIIKGDEVLIPLHPDLIVSVNTRHKTITMTLPEGLVNLND